MVDQLTTDRCVKHAMLADAQCCFDDIINGKGNSTRPRFEDLQLLIQHHLPTWNECHKPKTTKNLRAEPVSSFLLDKHCNESPMASSTRLETFNRTNKQLSLSCSSILEFDSPSTAVEGNKENQSQFGFSEISSNLEMFSESTKGTYGEKSVMSRSKANHSKRNGNDWIVKSNASSVSKLVSAEAVNSTFIVEDREPANRANPLQSSPLWEHSILTEFSKNAENSYSGDCIQAKIPSKRVTESGIEESKSPSSDGNPDISVFEKTQNAVSVSLEEQKTKQSKSPTKSRSAVGVNILSNDESVNLDHSVKRWSNKRKSLSSTRISYERNKENMSGNNWTQQTSDSKRRSSKSKLASETSDESLEPDIVERSDAIAADSELKEPGDNNQHPDKSASLQDIADLTRVTKLTDTAASHDVLSLVDTFAFTNGEITSTNISSLNRVSKRISKRRSPRLSTSFANRSRKTGSLDRITLEAMRDATADPSLISRPLIDGDSSLVIADRSNKRLNLSRSRHTLGNLNEESESKILSVSKIAEVPTLVFQDDSNLPDMTSSEASILGRRSDRKEHLDVRKSQSGKTAAAFKDSDNDSAYIETSLALSQSIDLDVQKNLHTSGTDKESETQRSRTSEKPESSRLRTTRSASKPATERSGREITETSLELSRADVVFEDIISHVGCSSVPGSTQLKVVDEAVTKRDTASLAAKRDQVSICLETSDEKSVSQEKNAEAESVISTLESELSKFDKQDLTKGNIGGSLTFSQSSPPNEEMGGKSSESIVQTMSSTVFNGYNVADNRKSNVGANQTNNVIRNCFEGSLFFSQSSLLDNDKRNDRVSQSIVQTMSSTAFNDYNRQSDVPAETTAGLANFSTSARRSCELQAERVVSNNGGEHGNVSESVNGDCPKTVDVETPVEISVHKNDATKNSPVEVASEKSGKGQLVAETPLQPISRKSLVSFPAFRERRISSRKSVSFLIDKLISDDRGKIESEKPDINEACQTSFTNLALSGGSVDPNRPVETKSFCMQTSRRCLTLPAINVSSPKAVGTQVTSSLLQNRTRRSTIRPQVSYTSFGYHTVAAEKSVHVDHDNARSRAILPSDFAQTEGPNDERKKTEGAQINVLGGDACDVTEKATVEDVLTTEASDRKTTLRKLPTLRGTHIVSSLSIFNAAQEPDGSFLKKKLKTGGNGSSGVEKRTNKSGIEESKRPSSDGNPDVSVFEKTQHVVSAPSEELKTKQSKSQTKSSSAVGANILSNDEVVSLDDFLKNLSTKTKVLSSTRISNENNREKGSQKNKTLPVMTWLDPKTQQRRKKQLHYEMLIEFMCNRLRYYCRSWPLTIGAIEKTDQPKLTVLSEVQKSVNKTVSYFSRREDMRTLAVKFTDAFTLATHNWAAFLSRLVLLRAADSRNKRRWLDMAKFYGGECGDKYTKTSDGFDLLGSYVAHECAQKLGSEAEKNQEINKMSGEIYCILVDARNNSKKHNRKRKVAARDTETGKILRKKSRRECKL